MIDELSFGFKGHVTSLTVESRHGVLWLCCEFYGYDNLEGRVWNGDAQNTVAAYISSAEFKIWL